MFWYHNLMETLVGIILVISAFNAIMLVVIGSALSKLIRETETEEEFDIPQKAPKSSKQMIDLPVVGPPTYDMAVFDGKAEPYTDGMERRLTPIKNWDGISQQ